jgi:hypothetical protein
LIKAETHFLFKERQVLFVLSEDIFVLLKKKYKCQVGEQKRKKKNWNTLPLITSTFLRSEGWGV